MNILSFILPLSMLFILHSSSFAFIFLFLDAPIQHCPSSPSFYHFQSSTFYMNILSFILPLSMLFILHSSSFAFIFLFRCSYSTFAIIPFILPLSILYILHEYSFIHSSSFNALHSTKLIFAFIFLFHYAPLIQLCPSSPSFYHFQSSTFYMNILSFILPLSMLFILHSSFSSSFAFIFLFRCSYSTLHIIHFILPLSILYILHDYSFIHSSPFNALHST
ncbi:unnamed protein product [Acanthosepion pharaonis]|uniref:Uncharacterized protein n=1 Tax=Acanthosepion pharaonis TaxID=158019 RepID=A0A812C749_ACAPH|nr:unnamed protein product [Sepia pharaonis]